MFQITNKLDLVSANMGDYVDDVSSMYAKVTIFNDTVFKF